MRNLSKIGKRGQMSPTLAVILIGIFAVAGYFIFVAEPAEQAVVQVGEQIAASDCADSTSILTVSDISKIPGGTAPTTPSITCGINGGKVATSVTSGTTTFPVGAQLECLVSDTDSLDERFVLDSVCGGTTLEGALYYSTSDNPGIRVKNDDGDFMTDAVGGGATNQTDLSAGETLSLEVEFQGTALEASGDGIWVVELPANSAVNVSEITLDGAQGVAIPKVHTLQNAASEAVAFEIDNVIGGSKESMTLQIVLEGSKDLNGGIYTDWYGKQWFIDDDSTLVYGVEDESGDAKYENTLDYDFFINAA